MAIHGEDGGGSTPIETGELPFEADWDRSDTVFYLGGLAACAGLPLTENAPALGWTLVGIGGVLTGAVALRQIFGE